MKKILKVLVPIFIVFLIADFAYKLVLLNSIHQVSDVVKTFLKERKPYGDDINLLYIAPEDEIVFEKLHIKNILDTYEKTGENTYYNKENDTYIQIYEDNMIEQMNLRGMEEYLEKNNIKDDRDIYNFLATYEIEKQSLFSSYSSIKNELFKCSLYQISYFSYDEAYKLTGDYDGYVFKGKEITNYYIYNGNTKYGINFIGFDSLNVTNEIVSSISFS